MVMKPEPLARAVEDIRERRGSPDAVVLLSPQGRTFTQAEAVRLSALRHMSCCCAADTRASTRGFVRTRRDRGVVDRGFCAERR